MVHIKKTFKNKKNMYCRIHRYRFESIIHDLPRELDPAIKPTVSPFPLLKKTIMIPTEKSVGKDEIKMTCKL